MHTLKYIHLFVMLTVAVLPIMTGCTGSRNREWKWQRCYKGPSRPSSEIAVLLVARDRLPIQVLSIDAPKVSDRTEYHLLPGDHALVSWLDGQLA